MQWDCVNNGKAPDLTCDYGVKLLDVMFMSGVATELWHQLNKLLLRVIIIIIIINHNAN